MVLGMAWLGAREWPALLPMTVAFFAAALAVARFRPVAASWFVLPLLYVFGALMLGSVGYSRNAFQAPMLAAVLGVTLARQPLRPWAVSEQWKLPLAWWALTVIGAAAVVSLRELDFSPSLLFSEERLANSGVGGPPSVILVWIGYVAGTHLVGLLWFDSFFAAGGLSNQRTFRNRILLPLAVSAIAGSLIASYQGIVDIYWLSGHGWGGQGRAAGGLVDGDAFGSLAGFWTGLFLALAASGGRGMQIFAAAGFFASWAGLWASGSRMALVAGLISTGGSLALAAVPVARRNRRRVFGAVAAVAVLIAVIASTDLQWQTDSPLRRTLQSLPSLDRASIAAFAEHQLWNRDAPFGTTFLWIMHDYPATGVGIGSFPTLYPDYAYLIRGHYGAPENAQSWYRNQLAEFGILGSLAWIWWLALLAPVILRTRLTDSAASSCFKATLLAVALVSAVSMPTQNAAVALTVWPMLFGFLAYSESAQVRFTAPVPAPSRRSWIVIWTAALLFVAATAAVGWWSLRPPARAVRANWTYSRGFEAVENSAGQPFRWTRKYAVEVPATEAAWMRLAIGGGPPDVAARPLRVAVKRNGELIIAYTSTDNAGRTWWIRKPDGPPRMMIEIEVDRTWSPADYGDPDTRQLGVAVLPWQFSNVPPRGADAIK